VVVVVESGLALFSGAVVGATSQLRVVVLLLLLNEIIIINKIDESWS
jgi:hypothetical protein